MQHYFNPTSLSFSTLMEMDLKIILFAFEYLHLAYYQKIHYTNDKSLKKIISKTLPNSVHYFFYFFIFYFCFIQISSSYTFVCGYPRQIGKLAYILLNLLKIFSIKMVLFSWGWLYTPDHFYTQKLKKKLSILIHMLLTFAFSKSMFGSELSWFQLYFGKWFCWNRLPEFSSQ